jgi:hypothetical protein
MSEKQHPTFDAKGHPSDGTLAMIKCWSHEDHHGLIEYVREAWHPDYGHVCNELGRLRFVTGGWSGNESLIAAMRDNGMFHSCCWESSHRGGLHTFRVPKQGKD